MRRSPRLHQRAFPGQQGSRSRRWLSCGRIPSFSRSITRTGQSAPGVWAAEVERAVRRSCDVSVAGGEGAQHRLAPGGCAQHQRSLGAYVQGAAEADPHDPRPVPLDPVSMTTVVPVSVDTGSWHTSDSRLSRRSTIRRCPRWRGAGCSHGAACWWSRSRRGPEGAPARDGGSGQLLRCWSKNAMMRRRASCAAGSW